MASAQHFLTLIDETRDSIGRLLDRAAGFKQAHKENQSTGGCERKTIGLYFEKASLRTRVSFEVAIRRLGGSSIFETCAIGVREPERDFAKVCSRYLDALVLRTFRHETVEKVAENSEIPVVNALTDRYHPCQALGDLLTIRETLGDLQGLKVTFIGDGNNVSRSLAIGCVYMGAQFSLAAPREYQFSEDFLARSGLSTQIEMTDDPREAATGADVVYTDVWTSMGKEAEAEKRRQAFASFQVDRSLLALAKSTAIVMHCLPAVRGEEVTADVLDGPQSVIYDQAENRLHVQQAILERLLVTGSR